MGNHQATGLLLQEVIRKCSGFAPLIELVLFILKQPYFCAASVGLVVRLGVTLCGKADVRIHETETFFGGWGVTFPSTFYFYNSYY
jgi:hypothetical protein